MIVAVSLFSLRIPGIRMNDSEKTTKNKVKNKGLSTLNLSLYYDGLEGIRTPDTLVRSQVL
jgi:hypothetical protein